MHLTATTADGATLCVDVTGTPADGAYLLIAGITQSMDWWDPELCARLAATGSAVVRYDHRDTGRSTGYPAGAPPYTGADLADDVLAVLDAVGVRRAHLVGLSMGGGIAQEVVLEHPDRVAALTLACTSPVSGDHDLPGPTEALRATFADPVPEPDYADRAAVVEYMVDVARPYGGPGTDEDWTRAVARRVVERTPDLAAALGNHNLMEHGEGSARPLRGLDVPALVVHGDADPLFPLPHGRALAAEIPGAELVVLEGLGHEQPPPARWDAFVALLSRTRR